MTNRTTVTRTTQSPDGKTQTTHTTRTKPDSRSVSAELLYEEFVEITDQYWWEIRGVLLAQNEDGILKDARAIIAEMQEKIAQAEAAFTATEADREAWIEIRSPSAASERSNA